MESEKLENIEILVDAREDDSVSSWVSSKSYRDVLEETRQKCPIGKHLMTLKEYMNLWGQTVQGGSRACNEADVWVRFEQDRQEIDPISYVRHPFLSTVLVDTYLRSFSRMSNHYEADVVMGGNFQGRVIIPDTGKIYGLNKFGLPNRTGGRKIRDSENFEHRWWAFSSDQIRNGQDINPDFEMALFGNGGTIGCFCELIKAHYSLDDSGGFYRVLTLPD